MWTGVFVSDAPHACLPVSQRRYGWNAGGKQEEERDVHKFKSRETTLHEPAKSANTFNLLWKTYLPIRAIQLV